MTKPEARKLAVVERSVDDLAPHASNARTHSEDQVAQIAASITEFGWTNPVLIDGAGGIIAGHGRVLAARLLGMTVVPCIVLDHLTEVQRRAYVLADNKLALNAGWDEELLIAELQALSEADFKVSLTGFADDELSALLTHHFSPATEPDDVPAVEVEAVSRTGDVWVLGRHRLMCGDSTDPAQLEQLAGGRVAVLCFTSPPYGQQRDYKNGGIADWDALMQGVFAVLPAADGAQVLVNLGMIHRDGEWIPYWDGWIAWMREAGWRRFGWYVWDQGPGLPGNWNGRLAPSHEFIFHFQRVGGAQARKTVKTKYGGQETHLRKDGSSTALRDKAGKVGKWAHAGKPTQNKRIPDSVVRVMRMLGGYEEALDALSDDDVADWPESVVRIMRHKARGIERGHPAVFPVALVTEMLTAFSDRGDVVFEPFSGSGTQLIAAEMTGRVCLAMELAPVYTDLAVRRWQAFAVQAATLEGDGRTFAEIMAERVSGPESCAAVYRRKRWRNARP